MKTIEKSPAVYSYQCEKCLTTFDTQVEAETCEASHGQCVGFISFKYEYQHKYPTAIEVRMNDGNKPVYELNRDAMEDLLVNATNNGKTVIAIVDAYDILVQKEYTDEEGKVVVEKLSGVAVKLENRKLYVDIPDEIQVLSTDTICVKVINEAGEEVTAESENSIFDEIVITAEVKQVVSNDCIDTSEETPTDDENTEVTE